MIDWYVEGIKFGNCSCDYSCPCQFELLPSRGYCHGIEIIRIDKGHFGDTPLDGLHTIVQYQWPGPVFEGKGEMQAIIDEKADAEQRRALATILHGKETKDAATHWWVFHAMSDTVHDPIFETIVFEVDVGARLARASIGDKLEASGRPIRSPVDGAPHRVRIDLPDGMEFSQAEIGSASTEARTNAMSLSLSDTYGQFNHFRISGKGFVRGGPSTR
ncbi:DUF1326 domain-containing protein [Acidisoma silvae]|uniref:DUF1326 domain-containing protein n=1 Tax=Acidisoma silvae TaxID=2802396 RepID=A0A963YTR6_9PROT|nr:DUF1326 domain-containing protein [Acidisoma silvae]MCB8876922.1 DUF1326 domain-containing protein [Acidisoma silvae]